MSRASCLRRCAVACWIGLMTGMPLAAQQGGDAAFESPLAMTRYDALVEELATASDAARRRFADAALGALIDAHVAELSGDGRAAGAWGAGARDYLQRLQRLRALLTAGAPLEIVREGQHAVRLIVGGEQVMLSALRDGAQRALETNIAEAVCAARQCAAATPTVDEVVRARERRLRGSWALADHEPPLFVQEDGLHCVFGDMRHLRLKQTACERVSRELRLLEEALRAVLVHGGRIDWASLRVGSAASAGPAGDVVGRRRVSYAADGRYFELDLPLLAAAPAVLQGAIPWLQTRLRGHAAVYVMTAPERLAYRVPDSD